MLGFISELQSLKNWLGWGIESLRIIGYSEKEIKRRLEHKPNPIPVMARAPLRVNLG